jgi:predicted deacetylase
MRHDRGDAVAVAIHDVEPATFGRTALIRDWLDDHGVDRVTLLVVPAPDLHPFSTSSPELVAWLLQRAERGDAIAQHGLTCRGPEFAGLGEDEARRAVDSGRRLLKLAGVEAHGFVAPGYAYTPALRATVRERYSWWADLLRLHRVAGGDPLAPAIRLSPLALRASALLGGPLLRIDLRPTDLEHTRHMLALERVLRRARRRTAVTYDQLAVA